MNVITNEDRQYQSVIAAALRTLIHCLKNYYILESSQDTFKLDEEYIKQLGKLFKLIIFIDPSDFRMFNEYLKPRVFEPYFDITNPDLD